MTPGLLARRMLGPAFRPLGELYRRAFVDMRRVVEAIDPFLPPNARILDVGGGDGYVVDLMLSLRADLTATMTDIAPDIGGFVRAANLDRVTLLPGVDLRHVAGRFDVITVADVVHHVPQAQRPGFLAALAATADRVGCDRIIVKDIEPGGLRARLALLGDLYITGDSWVIPAPADGIAVPGFTVEHRLMPDFPNYCLVLARAPAFTLH